MRVTKKAGTPQVPLRLCPCTTSHATLDNAWQRGQGRGTAEACLMRDSRTSSGAGGMSHRHPNECGYLLEAGLQCPTKQW
ncbi:hypothetical protein U9M48_036538 [Paspalum notatum var. saurae]|uniref:Uncharacterized protein n=1 Tax=Paspalum notatum var. saurae TaxID=547442 RepID=A0AAQ3X8E9_PASNO